MIVKSSALYFSVIIALFIAIVTASLLLVALHYRTAHLKNIRFSRLENNLETGLAFALTATDTIGSETKVDLYGEGIDSLFIVRSEWGIYEQVFLQTYIGQDTLKRSMLLGRQTDSVALYLSDENRPLSMSGKAMLVGDVYIPKSGIKKAYVDGKPYAYDKLVNAGEIKYSVRLLPALDTVILQRLRNKFTKKEDDNLLTEKSVKRSFFEPTLYFDLSKKALLKEIILSGNIILKSDSTVTIAASTKLDGVQVYAPTIIVEKGFEGNCQLFAIDSIVLKDDVQLNYPSVAVVLKLKSSGSYQQILMGKSVKFEGIVLIDGQKRPALPPMVSLDSATVLKGEVYSSGILKLTDNVTIEGKVSSNRFLMQRKKVLYENFLIDLSINRHVRSKYYLSSSVFSTKFPNQILRWLN